MLISLTLMISLIYFQSPSKVQRHLNVHAVSMVTEDIMEEIPVLGD